MNVRRSSQMLLSVSGPEIPIFTFLAMYKIMEILKYSWILDEFWEKSWSPD